MRVKHCGHTHIALWTSIVLWFLNLFFESINCFSGCLLIKLFAALFALLSWGRVLYLSFFTSVVSSKCFGFFDWLLLASFWTQWLFSVHYCVLEDRSLLDLICQTFKASFPFTCAFALLWSPLGPVLYLFLPILELISVWTWTLFSRELYPVFICFVSRFHHYF